MLQMFLYWTSHDPKILLEATGWSQCHAQVQCYTFSCLFFADSQLARHQSTCLRIWHQTQMGTSTKLFYQHHFIHVVSQNDIIPKVMPPGHT
ncbi:hypothetical protein CY35_17G034400 [Sphagnum magellanicum]|nr:hypothetical protein CY35_17G034400 [Sphagnum magellanicum]